MFRRLACLALVATGFPLVLGCQPVTDTLPAVPHSPPGDVVDLSRGAYTLHIETTVEAHEGACLAAPVELGWVGDDDVPASVRVPSGDEVDVYDVVLEDGRPVGIPRLDMGYVLVDGRCEGTATVEVHADEGEGWFRVRFQVGTEPVDHWVHAEPLD